MEAKELIETMENLRVKLQLFMEETKHNLLDELYPKPYIDATFDNKNPLIVDGMEIIFLYYDNVIPSYKETTKDKEYGRNISHYYALATARQIASLKRINSAERKVLFIEQHYRHKYHRDLDNRNRKLLIDAIKYNHLISDDNMNHLSIYEKGMEGQPLDETLVFLIDEADFPRFLAMWNGSKSEAISAEIYRRKIVLESFEKELDLK